MRVLQQDIQRNRQGNHAPRTLTTTVRGGGETQKDARSSRLEIPQKNDGPRYFSKGKETCQRSACKNKKFPYQCQPKIRPGNKDRLLQQSKEKEGKTATQTRTAAEPEDSPQGRKPTQPIMPPPDQPIRKVAKISQSNKKFGNDTRKKWEIGETPTSTKSNREKEENGY